MNRLRTRLMLVFLAATILPVAAVLLVTARLLEHSVSLNPTRELDATTRALEVTGRALYQSTREALGNEVQRGLVRPAKIWRGRPEVWPADIREFHDSGLKLQFSLGGQLRDYVQLLRREADGSVGVYIRQIGGPGMKALADQFYTSRSMVERLNARNLRRGFITTLIVISALLWILCAAVVLYLSRRISRPLEQLTAGLARLASGDLRVRLKPAGADEVSDAMRAFNATAAELEQSRDKLVHVTRLESWQSLGRKMAHEVKNSLTPIRLTVEEIVARRGEHDAAFIEQAAQIVVEEVSTLERRVRAFTEFASEPPVQIEDVDIGSTLEERIALLRSAHPEVSYRAESETSAHARADADLVKGVLTNLLANAAEAAGPGGVVLSRVRATDSNVLVEVHDSGPGLTPQARDTLFEPTISFKKAGMGLGLSIAKRSAMLLGGDIVLMESELGGAGFRVVLPRVMEENAGTARSGA
ncbi:MAG TPA: ATP-binding protein [Bryobacteraceae bacterium]|nr:ATP-binding protein [Bryobacteraceae bacterium]